MPPDVRKASGFPSELKLLFEVRLKVLEAQPPKQVNNLYGKA